MELAPVPPQQLAGEINPQITISEELWVLLRNSNCKKPAGEKEMTKWKQ